MLQAILQKKSQEALCNADHNKMPADCWRTQVHQSLCDHAQVRMLYDRGRVNCSKASSPTLRHQTS